MTLFKQRSTVYTSRFLSWEETLPPLLDRGGLVAQIPAEQPILLKPNLVEELQPPITTPVALVRALVDYLQARVENPILIGEGCGALDYDTDRVFQVLGYTKLAKEKGVSLVDLNKEQSRRSSLKHCWRWPEIFLPELCFSCFLISVPVLKVHTLAGVTLTMKNMMGLAPPSQYQQGGAWKKSAFHTDVQEAIADLNRYRRPDYTVLDATVGMAEAHLWGRTCDPPVNRLVVGGDPVAVDSYGTALLGKEWQDVGHIAAVHGELGWAEPVIEEV